MEVRQFRYSEDNLGYLVYGNKTALAVDGGAVEEMMHFINDKGLQLAYITNTHCHMDHTVGNDGLLSRTGAEYLDFRTLLKWGKIDLDDGSLIIFHTPGHTRDSVCFYGDPYLLSGDTLFNGKVGRCFTGDEAGFLNSIKTLLALPDRTIVYAGHDYVEEYMEFARRLEPDNPHINAYLEDYDPEHVCATLGDEKKVDPFLRFNDPKIIDIFNKKGLAAETEAERWQSLMSLM